MRTLMRASMIAAFLAALAIASGCEDSPVTAGKDFTMGLVATPSTVVIDPPHGINEADATIVATVLNATGAPQTGLTVYFSNTSGVLASGTAGVLTNANGIATDVLTVRSEDTAEITITATSGTLSKTVEVTKATAVVNRPPVAAIVADPASQQASGRAVVFDGSNSSDPDTGDFITNYRWVITSTNPDVGKANPFIVQGAGVSGVSFPSDTVGAFINVQDLTVVLQVTDNRATQAQSTIPYKIVAVNCSANTKPTAVIAGAPTQQIFGAPGTIQSFILDGTLSSDPETAIETYTYSCGNGTNPLPQLPPSKAICKYTVDATPRTYTATLVVSDKGTGVIDPATGNYQCAAVSTPASVQVAVTPLAGVAP